MKSSLKGWATTGAAFGAALAITIYMTSFVPQIADIWWWNNLIFVLWPSFFLMMGFSGPIDSKTLIALALAVVLNAGIYAIVAAVFYGVLKGARSRAA